MIEMKDTGIEWINLIPDTWEIKRIKAVLRERNESNNPVKTDYILSLTNDRGVIPYDEKGEVGNKSKEDLTGYKLAYPNDIVLNSMNVFIGSVALSKYYGCVSPVYYMLRVRNDKDDIRFYNYLFQTKQLQTKLHGYGNGIMDIRMRIQMSKLNTVMLPIPSSEEQHIISDYLDDKCSKIDGIIAKQELIIQKLREYYLSRIADSIESYNDVSHNINFRRVITNVEQGWSPSPAERKDENGWKVLTLAAVKNGIFHSEETKEFVGNQEKCKSLQLKEGDFLLTRSNTRNLVGQVCIVDEALENTIFSDLIYRISFDKKLILTKYALFMMQSTFLRQQIERDAHGSSSTMVKITHKDISGWKILLPSIEEQNRICRMLSKLQVQINKEIEGREEIVSKLNEYKKSLIYEVVTGKKEV